MHGVDAVQVAPGRLTNGVEDIVPTMSCTGVHIRKEAEMAKGTVNKAILIGRLGADPELRYTPSGVAVVNFRIATDHGWKDDSGEWQDRTEWHNIVAWRDLAERCAEYLKKGQRVYIEGQIQTRSWEGQDGVRRYKTEIVARMMEMLEGRQSAPDQEAPMPEPEQMSAEEPIKEGEEEDDLPF